MPSHYIKIIERITFFWTSNSNLILFSVTMVGAFPPVPGIVAIMSCKILVLVFQPSGVGWGGGKRF